jgi:UDP-N-acetylglucosamine pyrophosphorylase
VLGVLSSCTTTKYVPVIEHQTDTVYQNRVLKDSVYLHDSIEVKIKGNSVTIDRWHTKYVEKQIHDTTYIATHDTIPQPYPVEVVKEVEKELTWWQRQKIAFGELAMIVMAGLLVFVLIKFKIIKF